LVISDDHSTDGTLSLVYSFKFPSGILVRVIRNPERVGYIKNFERALRACAGDVIFLCDQDDKWHTDKIDKMMAAKGNALLVHTDARLIDETGEVLAESYSGIKKKHPENSSFARLIDDNCVTGCTAMVKRELVEQSPPFSEEMPHDQWLALLAADRNRLSYMPVSLLDYRQHSGNATGAGDDWRTFSLPRSARVNKGKHAEKALRLKAFLDKTKSVLNEKNRATVIDLIHYHECFADSKLNVCGMFLHLKHFRSINFRESIFKKAIKLLLTPVATLGKQ